MIFWKTQEYYQIYSKINEVKMKPLVSIIVPVYNVESYLKKCINSLINQSYLNIEILLIDDGSIDNSGMICEQYAKKHNNVYVYHKKNTGLGLTRNYGLSYAKGKYITFVDSDDYAEKDLIKRLIAPILNDSSIDTVIGGFTRINDSGRILAQKSNISTMYEKSKVKNELFPRMLGSLPDSKDTLKPSVWNCLYSKKIIDQYGLKFVSERKLISEDIEWDSHYFEYAKKVKLINSVSYYYRLNPNSLSRKIDFSKLSKYLYFYEYMKKRLVNMGLNNTSILRLQKYVFVALATMVSQIKNESYQDSFKLINKICNDIRVKEILESYPIYKLPVKQKLFVKALKNKHKLVLFFVGKYILN